MTEEIIKMITDAEKQAAEIKRSANERAAKILLEAEEQASRKEKSSADVCKAYKETQMNAAKKEAEIAYENSLLESEKNAKSYCAQALDSAEVSVAEIVGRIVRGDC